MFKFKQRPWTSETGKFNLVYIKKFLCIKLFFLFCESKRKDQSLKVQDKIEYKIEFS